MGMEEGEEMLVKDKAEGLSNGNENGDDQDNLISLGSALIQGWTWNSGLNQLVYDILPCDLSFYIQSGYLCIYANEHGCSLGGCWQIQRRRPQDKTNLVEAELLRKSKKTRQRMGEWEGGQKGIFGDIIKPSD